MTRKLALVFATALAGSCGGNAGPNIPSDPVLERQTSAGRAALALEQPEQAAKQYRDALIRARARDDATAIGDLGFNLAVAELSARQPDAALRTAREVSAELRRRSVPPPDSLELAEAIALYRIGRAAEADSAAARIETKAEPETAARAAFLRGLIADADGNTATLQQAHAKVAAATGGEALADESELAARLALRSGDPRLARATAEQAVAMRRDLLDYRGVSRCLALAALAAEQAGDVPSAADLYLRAGRGAADQKEQTLARKWLSRAIILGQDPALLASARSALASTGERHQ
jgi:tetratricopeptide (TPR) repeat protein